METKTTAEYPVRYVAFDNPGILFRGEQPKESGGHEWAVFWNESNKLYGSIYSYQDKHLAAEVVKNGHPKYSEVFPYCQIERAVKKLAEQIGLANH